VGKMDVVGWMGTLWERLGVGTDSHHGTGIPIRIASTSKVPR